MVNESIGRDGIKKLLEIVKHNSGNNSSSSAFEISRWYMISCSSPYNIFQSVDNENTWQTDDMTMCYSGQIQLVFAISTKINATCNIAISFYKSSSTAPMPVTLTLNDGDAIGISMSSTQLTKGNMDIKLSEGVNNLIVKVTPSGSSGTRSFMISLTPVAQ